MFTFLNVVVLALHSIAASDTCSLKQVLTQMKSTHQLTEKLQIEIFDFYGYHDVYGNYHPQNLLSSSMSEWYCSKLVKQMEGNHWCQPDWIIFKITDNDCLYLPSSVSIINHSAEAAVKFMSVYIGDADKNEWYRLKDNPLEFAMQKQHKQSKEFNYDATDWNYNIVRSKRLRHLKIELLDNHMGDAWRFGDSCNFLFYHLSFSGYCLAD